MKKQYLFFFFVLLSHTLVGQNLEKIGSKDMGKVSGGLSSNFVGNTSWNQSQYRDPFAWVLGGNITVTILDVSLPFTFSFSDAGKSYTQPFNMTAVHPSYKWVKTHIGITSMNFSPYTYSGLNFTGGGFELSPKSWKIQAFGGRLKRAVDYDATVNNLATVSYKRMGFGLLTGYEKNGYGLEMILLKAYDDENSLSIIAPATNLAPQDNLVLSFKGKAKLMQCITANAEFARTFLTRNVAAFDSTQTAVSARFYDNLIRANNTTIAANAYNTSLQYKYKFFGIGGKYERIDPLYTTLGGLYFNNDLENITLTPSLSLFNNKVSLSANTGYQRNNLANDQVNVSKRWVGSLNGNFILSKKLNVNASYSNFSSFSRRNPAADPFFNPIFDTLNYYQISQNASGSVNYAFGDTIKQNLMLNASYNQSQNITGRLEDAAAFGFNVSGNDIPVNVYSGVFSHSFLFPKQKLTFSYMINGNISEALGQQTAYFGPGINVARPLLNKKINASFGTTYNQQFSNKDLTNHVLNFRTSLSMSPEFWDKKYGKINIGVNANLTEKLAVKNTSPSSGNFVLMVNIGYGI